MQTHVGTFDVAADGTFDAPDEAAHEIVSTYGGSFWYADPADAPTGLGDDEGFLEDDEGEDHYDPVSEDVLLGKPGPDSAEDEREQLKKNLEGLSSTPPAPSKPAKKGKNKRKK